GLPLPLGAVAEVDELGLHPSHLLEPLGGQERVGVRVTVVALRHLTGTGALLGCAGPGLARLRLLLLPRPTGLRVDAPLVADHRPAAGGLLLGGATGRGPVGVGHLVSSSSTTSASTTSPSWSEVPPAAFGS